jgi:hypothetical protein
MESTNSAQFPNHESAPTHLPKNVPPAAMERGSSMAISIFVLGPTCPGMPHFLRRAAYSSENHFFGRNSS